MKNYKYFPPLTMTMTEELTKKQHILKQIDDIITEIENY